MARPRGTPPAHPAGTQILVGQGFTRVSIACRLLDRWPPLRRWRLRDGLAGPLEPRPERQPIVPAPAHDRSAVACCDEVHR